MKILGLFVLVLAVLVMPPASFAQQGKAENPAASSQTQTHPGYKHGMSDQQMKEHENMMSKMKDMDARLDAKVAAMDAAKGDQKIEAMAAVIKEMVAQRNEMREHMTKMHAEKKGHMGHD